MTARDYRQIPYFLNDRDMTAGHPRQLRIAPRQLRCERYVS